MFKYTTAIDKIRRLEKKIKIIQGGTSAGKTWAILPILIDIATRNKNIVISVVSESLPHLRRGAMRDFLNIMKMTNRYVEEHWSKTLSIYTFGNGSIIEFFSASDEDKLRGARRNVLYINECNNVNLYAYTELSQRTQNKGKFNSQIFLDYNPTHKFWIDEIKGSDTDFLILNYLDNEALEQDVIDYIEDKKIKGDNGSEYWKNWYKVYGLGLEGTLEGTIFPDYNIVRKIPDGVDYLGAGLDFGYTNDPTTLIKVYKLKEDLYFEEVIYQKGLSNSEIFNIIKSYGLENNFNVADSAEPKSIAELRSFGMKVYPATKGKDSIIHGIQLLHNYNLNILENSVNLLREFRNYSYMKIKGETTNKPIDAFNHGIDAIRYLCSEVLKNKSDAEVIFIDL